MKFEDRQPRESKASPARGPQEQPLEAQESELEQALGLFRQSVHAWSAAELSRPRTVALAAAHRTWRTAAAWALGCVLAAGSLGGGLYDRHLRQQAALAAARQAQSERLAARQQAQAAARQDDARLFATLDSDVSREVPSAMEPLAQLMDDTNP
ncbi:MAG: hypothetical protein ACLGP3_10395 [Acidobacteriota bacterium]